MSQIIVVKDSANNKLRELECDASGNLKVIPDISSLTTQVMSAVSNESSGTVKSTAVDANNYRSMCAYGSTDRATGEINIEVSHDNSSWYELNNAYVAVDMFSGNFGIQMDISARYVRLSRTNTHATTEIINAHISLK